MSEEETDLVRQSLGVLRQAAGKYQDMIVKDPEFTSKLESALRIASYIIPGHFGGSWEFSELAYSISNLYALGNDYIIAKKCPASCQISKRPERQQLLLWLLSLLDCMEVAIEMMTQRYAGEPAKWGMVIIMQIIRALLRSLLVFKFGHGLLLTPSVPSPDRKSAQALQSAQIDSEGQPLAWKAPRTGKVIRSIHADDSVPYSQLHHYVAPSSPPSGQSGGVASSSHQSGPLKHKELFAEVLYIARPLIHIFSMITFNHQSWKPWVISLAVDVVSLQLLGSPTSYPQKMERSEITRRRVVLLLYLLRSPFYDHHTKSIIIQVLKYISGKFPLVHYVIDPILEYLPVWQQIYSYCWMT